MKFDVPHITSRVPTSVFFEFIDLSLHQSPILQVCLLYNVLPDVNHNCCIGSVNRKNQQCSG